MRPTRPLRLSGTRCACSLSLKADVGFMKTSIPWMVIPATLCSGGRGFGFGISKGRDRMPGAGGTHRVEPGEQ